MEVKKIKQKHQSRLVEEKVELELLWDEGKQRLGQAARGREKRGKRAVLSERYWKRSAALTDFFFMRFLSPLRPVAKLLPTSHRAQFSSVSADRVSRAMINPPAIG